MPVNDDYDSPWKEVLEHAFPEFMAFYFPDAHRQIDWVRGHDFHDTELRQVVRDAELGRRYADILARVTLWGGQQRWVYVHVEVQGQADSDFARRMFTYNYRLYDRHAVPVASLALLADDDVDWRPTDYGFDVLGCRHQLDLFAILDWMMRLTPALEQQLWQDIHVIEGELHMPYVTSMERMAIERGFNQGYLQGAQRGEEKGRLEG